MGWKTIAISMTAPLPDLLTNLKVIALEKVFFDDIQNCKTFC